MKSTGLVVAILSISIAGYGGTSQAGEYLTLAANSTSTASQPTNKYPRLLPLQMSAPSTAQAGVPIVGVSVSLQNPGAKAPNSRLRLSIHETAYAGAHHTLTPKNVKVEVMENGAWVPVDLASVDGNVMGAIGPEGVGAHRDRYSRGGFEIPAGMYKTWQLRVTFNVPGTYSLVATVSPNNGSTHLAQPAHSIIAVQ